MKLSDESSNIIKILRWRRIIFEPRKTKELNRDENVWELSEFFQNENKNNISNGGDFENLYKKTNHKKENKVEFKCNNIISRRNKNNNNFSIYKRNEEDISNNAKENKIKFERFLDDINKKNEQENKVNEKNEGFINGSNMIPLDPIIETVKSICKIKTLEYSVSGFFIKLEKREEDFLCLMTNGKNNRRIYLYGCRFNCRWNITWRWNIKWIFFTTFYLLHVQFWKIRFWKNYYNSLSKWYIKLFLWKNRKYRPYTFSHSASTDIGLSGGPIFLKNTTKVIGIHKSTNEDIPINYGNFIGPIYKYFRNLQKHKDRFNNKN